MITALHMSAFGTKGTLNCRPAMSAFGGKADMVISERDVCFWTQSGHEQPGLLPRKPNPESYFASRKFLV